MDSERALRSFKEFTGYTNDEDARRLLAKFGWNLERAINAFFARNLGGSEAGENAAEEDVVLEEPKPHQRISHFSKSRIAEEKINGNRKNEAFEHQANELNESVEVIENDDIQMLEENDLQRSQKSQNGISGTASAVFSSTDNSDDVRAPIASVEGVLVNQTFRETYQSRGRLLHPIFEQHRHDNSSSLSGTSSKHIAHRSTNETLKRLAAARPDLGEEVVIESLAHRPSPAVVHSADQPSTNVYINSKKLHLQALFRPPVELMFQGDWDQARQAARQKEVWLLVNVQDISEFACAVLNRDIWAYETVRDVVRSNFLFWQVHHDSADGARIRSYYGFTTYPAIFIVDPRTGEEVTGCLRALDPISFLDSLTSFLDKNPTFDARDQRIRNETLAKNAAISPQQRPLPSISPPQIGAPPTKKRKLPGSSGSTKSNGLDGLDQEPMMKEDGGEEEMSRQAKKMKRIVTITDDMDILCQQPSTSTAKNDSYVKCVQNANEWRQWTHKASNPSAGIVRLLCRLPDGRCEKLCLRSTTPLNALFSFILSLGFAPSDHQLILDFPRREYRLTSQNYHMALEAVGFGAQEVIYVNRIKP